MILQNIFSLLFPSLNFVDSTDTFSFDLLNKLQQKLINFYNNKIETEFSYYNESWAPSQMPFQLPLLELSSPGMKVLDLGCGPAHAYGALFQRQVEYTGIDCCERQIAKNQEAYAAGRFKAASIYDTKEPAGSYDLVFSLYVLEHTVWPQIFLAEMFRLVKPGGYCFILCPEFRQKNRLPSLKQGTSVVPLKQKLKSLRLFDAALHLFHRNLYYPLYIRNKFKDTPFLINLRPTCFEGPWYPDNDAVYFVSEKEVKEELTSLSAVDVTDEFYPSKLRHSKPSGICYVVCKKPV